LQATELAFEIFGALEAVAPDNFHRAQGAEGVAGKPDLAVSARSDGPQEFVFRNYRHGDQGGLKSNAAKAHMG